MIQKIPMCRAALLALTLLFTTPFVSAYSQSAATTPTIAYPQTKRGDVVDKPFGQTIADPYRWLENDVRSDKEVAAWVESQNKVTNTYLDKLPGQDIFKARLKQLYNYEKFTIPVMDMLRFDQFTAGKLWVDEYGSPAREADFRNLFNYSPYHNIQSGKAYPAILATTADTDDRVIPGQTFKYVAALQAANIGDKPHLVRIETRAGHGAGKPTDKIIEETADMWAFAAQWTGLDVK